MTEFWSYIQNDQYCVGCTGQTVHLYKKQGGELARFRDLPSVFRAVFSPAGTVFAAKSADGRIAIYSLRERRLLYSFRFGEETEQDAGFCYTRNGDAILNIERRADGSAELCIYDGRFFAPQKRLFGERKGFCLAEVVPDSEQDCCYLLGFRRGEDGQAERFFVTRLAETREDERTIRRDEYLFYREYLRLAAAGFTDKAMLLSPLRYEGYDLRKLQQEKRSLAMLWKRKA